MAPDRIVATNARRTGVIEVDRVIDALFGDDQAALDALVRAQSAVCHEVVLGLGDMEVCPEGVAEGTLVEFFFAGNCHGYPQHERPFVVPFDPELVALFAVAKVPDSVVDGEFAPAGDQLLVFVVPGNPPSNVTGFIVEAGMVVRRVGGCGNTADTLLAQGGDSPDYLLEPFALPE
ncbi:MAG: hypothetical protein DWG75_01415 [Chloroflexi bacterium]|nr:hypothetical protein [Chloroflexota bacterium]